MLYLTVTPLQRLANCNPRWEDGQMSPFRVWNLGSEQLGSYPNCLFQVCELSQVMHLSVQAVLRLTGINPYRVSGRHPGMWSEVNTCYLL